MNISFASLLLLLCISLLGMSEIEFDDNGEISYHMVPRLHVMQRGREMQHHTQDEPKVHRDENMQISHNPPVYVCKVHVVQAKL